MGLVNLPTNLIDRIIRLERGLEAVRKLAGLTSAIIRRGGLTLLDDSFLKVVDDTETEIVYIGPDVDGKQILRLRREGGSNVIYTYTHPNGSQYWALTDRANRVLASDDAVTGVGLARPWLPVPMYRLFTGPANSVYAYETIDAAVLTSERQLWEGRIGLVSHPKIEIYGVWGQVSGTNNTTYRLLINGTSVGTWSANTLQNNTQGPFDITPYIEAGNVQVSLVAQTSGTGRVAVGLLGCWQRQSP